jgi:peptide/nickel transport system substrate-binding protein
MGIDRKTIVDRVYGGKASIANAWVPPQDPMHAADLKTVQYDPAAARKLLADAGWHPAEDGICRNETGTRLSLMFQGSAGNKLIELVQQVIQNQWKGICVETVIKNEPFRTLFGETLKRRQFTGLALYGWVFSVSYPPRQTLGSDQIPSPATNFAGSNYMDWHNASVDAGIKVTENELDAGKRQVAWAAMQHAYADELPVLPLFFPETAVALPKWLHGYVPTGITDYPPLWVESWRAE